VPGYGSGAFLTTGDVRRLVGAVNLEIDRAVLPMDSPAMLLPPIFGRWQLILKPDLHPAVVRHITLHEVAHVISGDIDEPTYMTWAGPLPPNEDWADLFSLVALLHPDEITDDETELEHRILDLVPLDVPGWAGRRVPRLAGKLPRLKALLGEMGA
jgi:hypothetical protein